jgi:hypothetical protein
MLLIRPMNSAPTRTDVPKPSAIAAYLPDAYFHDSWSVAARDPCLSALGQFVGIVMATPPWVNKLMAIRNTVVSAIGLKNLGTLSHVDQAKPASAYRPGDRVGIFTLIENTADEVLLGDKDKHLDVVVSVHKAEDETSGGVLVTVTTVVHVHNWLGRLYMLPVTPLHRVIAPAVLKAVARR